MSGTFVERSDDLRAIERGVRNKFRWAWLEEKDTNGDFLKDYIGKIPEPGVCICLICCSKLIYAKKGRSIILRHAHSAAHARKRVFLKANQILPSHNMIIYKRLEKEGNMTTPISTRSSGVARNTPDYIDKKKERQTDTHTHTEGEREIVPVAMPKERTILILQTGGTIDKIYPRGPGACAFEIGEPAVEKILNRVCATFPYLINSICTKDSSDVTDFDRDDMLSAVAEADQQLILITHGTDTLCDTAQYLINAGVGQGSQHGPAVGEKTVVLVGASTPEAMKESDADFNIGFALGCLQSSCPGVFVAMGGNILDGNYVMRSDDGRFVDERYVKEWI